MTKKILSAALMLAVALSYAGASDHRDEGDQTKCPVMGNPINKDVFTDYKGHRIFFCCSGCIEDFKKNPEAYLEKMKAEGVQPKKLMEQSVCPVSGKELAGKDFYVDHEGQCVYLCCESCKKAFASDPAKYLKVLSDRGEAPEQLPAEEKSSGSSES